MSELKCEDGVCEVPSQTTNPSATIIQNPIDKPKLLYFGDPMCSWCWGVANHLDALIEEFSDKLSFELVLGGLRPGGGEEWNEEFRNMLRTHWEHVHEASGQPFDYSFFERDAFEYDTEPPARAVRVVRDIAPDKEWEFYKLLQEMFYAENQNILDPVVLERACTELEIDYLAFEPLFESEGYKRLVYQDFIRSQQLGVRGFPAIVIQKGEEYIAVTMGYSDLETMKQRTVQILAD
ncbi:putative protein-disulfide isomerase [Reichenbachiella agariperforans]|uniref:DSBA-like thioredoxin domain-containing protein n=1 Tax=Reichenbachiella agariperforans TaxID=156994 RepID=A0A1M6KID3_REIAG|nr:DsbA family protein [Reichenbachiella agariperforans]SHJ58685.1 putative protein-disulfide isomerase [Reichenbachiella agariperforans]